ncbi:helix-turn-helix transcriptional regulator [Chitinophaga sp.]|uniref:helix-turn-helix domain-containing protein n=1 Tax=Chitinophaga sp. TaxID=1869181 RepID=UPI0031CF0BBA
MKVRNDAYLKAFGENLKQLMAKSNKNAETVAALGGIETKQVYRVINGEHSATLSIVYAIAKGLEVHPKELFDFTFQE